MKNHEQVREDLKKEGFIDSIAPEFNELTADIKELRGISKDPFFLAAMVFKLTKERENTNKLLETIDRKFDEIMLQMKTRTSHIQAGDLPNMDFETLPDQDQLILNFIAERGQCTAFDVQGILNYRGLNGASQRLNKLCKDGYLKKARSGKKVLYLAKC